MMRQTVDTTCANDYSDNSDELIIGSRCTEPPPSKSKYSMMKKLREENTYLERANTNLMGKIHKAIELVHECNQRNAVNVRNARLSIEIWKDRSENLKKDLELWKRSIQVELRELLSHTRQKIESLEKRIVDNRPQHDATTATKKRMQ
jgi:hypothetical protein